MVTVTGVVLGGGVVASLPDVSLELVFLVLSAYVAALFLLMGRPSGHGLMADGAGEEEGERDAPDDGTH